MARRHLRNLADEIEWRSYRPPPPYRLDAEILSVRDLRMRATAEHLRRAHRIDFHLLIFVTSGKCNHVVDFKPVRCRSGSLLVLRPSQAEQFDVTSDWDGWLVLFRPSSSSCLNWKEAPMTYIWSVFLRATQSLSLFTSTSYMS